MLSAEYLRLFQSLLPPRFHHLLCSYVPLIDTSFSHNDSAANSCNDVGTYDHANARDITDFSDVGDAACSYCLPASGSESNDAVSSGPTSDMCQLSSAEELLHMLSNNHDKTVRNSSEPSSCADGGINADVDNIEAGSAVADDCDNSHVFHYDRVGFKARLRVNVQTLTELELWQKDFAERSKTTMRYANVSACCGKKTLHKVSN